MSDAEKNQKSTSRLRVLMLAGWSSALLIGLQVATGAFYFDSLGVVLGCIPFVACAAACGLVYRRLAAPAPHVHRRVKWALVAVVAAMLAYGFSDLVRVESDRWAARVVQTVKGPVRVTVVNTTDAMHEVEIGRGAFTCHISCLKPGKRRDCEPEFYGPSLLRARLPQAGFLEHSDVPFEELPVPVLWNSYGTVEVYVTDAGFVVDGGFSTELF